MTIKGVLFDVDGVIYNTMPQHAKSWIEAFKERGLKLKAKPVYECEGMPEVTAAAFLLQSIPAKLPKKVVMKIVERKREVFNSYKNPPQIKGAKKLLKYLQRNNYKICFVTGSHQLRTIKNLQKDFGVKRGMILTGKDIPKGKPAPDPYLKGLEKVKLPAKHVLVVENAPLGIISAKRARLKCVAITTGMLTKKDLTKYRPDLIAKDCTEVCEWLS